MVRNIAKSVEISREEFERRSKEDKVGVVISRNTNENTNENENGNNDDIDMRDTWPCDEPSAKIPAVSDRDSHAIADIELCGDRYGASVLEFCKPLDIVGDWPGFLVPFVDDIDGSVAFGSSKAAYVSVRLFVCCCSDNCHIATWPDSRPQNRRTKRDGESRRRTFDQPKQVGTKKK